MRSLFFLCLMIFSNSLCSQIKISHYASSQNDLHYRNGRNYGGMGFFTIAGGVGCMLAPSVQFNSSIGVSTYGSTSDILFLTAGVVLIGVGIALLISNERNRKSFSENSPMLKYETFNLSNSNPNIQKGFPAIGFKIPLN